MAILRISPMNSCFLKNQKGSRKERPSILKFSLSFLLILLKYWAIKSISLLCYSVAISILNLHVLSLPIKYIYPAFLQCLSFSYLIFPLKKNSKINDQEPQSVTLEVKWWYTALLVLSDLELCQFSKQTINVS